MELYLLTDNQDTLTGLRLAGIEGKIVTSAEQITEQTSALLQNSNIGIILISPNVHSMCKDFFMELKKNKYPLILEVPDSDPDASSSDSVTEYIRNAVGIKI